MKRYEQAIRKVVPYVPGEQPVFADKVKLNTNENPYPPAPGVQKALENASAADMRLYPDPTSNMLNSAIAKRYGVKTEQVFTGVGSDDVLAMIFQTFFNSDLPILFPNISYSFYPVWAELFKIPYQMVALNENLEIVPEDYKIENGGVVFPNPNAPTGLLLGLDAIEKILQYNSESIVVVDEAYIDFGGTSALSLLNRYENLIVVQTFSKSRSMAGARIGFAIASEKLIRALHDVKYSFNSYTLNRSALELGTAAITDEAYFQETTAKIIATRENAKKRLAALGFHFPDSMSNFIFATHEKWNAEKLFQALKEKHIFVRWFSGDIVKDYLRITIGTDEEMEKLFAFLETYEEK